MKRNADVLAPVPFPQEGKVRVNQIVGNPEKGVPPFFPVSRAQWHIGVGQGIYPAGVKISERITVWDAQEIREFVAALCSNTQAA